MVEVMQVAEVAIEQTMLSLSLYSGTIVLSVYRSVFWWILYIHLPFLDP